MKLKKSAKLKVAIASAIIVLIGVTVLVITNLIVLESSKPFILSQKENLPQAQAALVLGAKVYANYRMSQILADRVTTALELYRTGKVKKLLLSGDHTLGDYDEVNTMKDFLLKEGVPAADIFLDHAGIDTYDSVYRAQAIFQVKTIIIITQKFHLPRAVYLARSIGIDAYGFPADQREYAGMFWNNLRESFARFKAVADISTHAQPKFLGPIIPIDGDSRLSWD